MYLPCVNLDYCACSHIFITVLWFKIQKMFCQWQNVLNVMLCRSPLILENCQHILMRAKCKHALKSACLYLLMNNAIQSVHLKGSLPYFTTQWHLVFYFTCIPGYVSLVRA